MAQDKQKEDRHTSLARCLQCARCRTPIILKSDIIQNILSFCPSTVFSYEFECEVLETKFPLYSALNPSKTRFDVCAVKQNSTLDNKINISYDWYDADSWFIGYEWTFVACKKCSSFLGWAYRPSSPSEPKVNFIGLIITRLRPSKVDNELIEPNDKASTI